MTTKAAALAIRKGEQKGAIAEKKAAHERVFDLLYFTYTAVRFQSHKWLLCSRLLQSSNTPLNHKSGCSARASCRVQTTPLNANPSHKPEPVRLAFIYMSD